MTALQPFRKLDSRTAVLARADIDTDQIIPARYLKGTTRAGLGRWLFAGWRYDEQGRPRADFPLSRPEAHGAQVLVAGANFGCGSSREHATWALRDFGFRAIIAPSFADIFRANCYKTGLLAVTLPDSQVRHLIDLESCTLAFGDARVSFAIDPFSRRCLLQGVDELGYLLEQEDAIAAYEKEQG